MSATTRTWWQRLLVPVFDEVALFVMGASFLTLFVIDDAMRDAVTGFLMRDDPRGLVSLLIAGLGLWFAIYQFFSRSEPSGPAKGLMIIFVVGANAGAGITAAIHLWAEYAGVWRLIPAWNMLMAALLLIFFPSGARH